MKRLDRLIFDLSVQLITHSDFNNQKSALMYFSAILGYSETTKTFRPPQNYTPYLGQLQYCIRIILFEYALPMEERDALSETISIYDQDEGGPDPLSIFKRVRNKWLVSGQPSPFNQIQSLLQYGMHAGKEFGGKDRVLWSPDKQTMIFNGRPLELTKFKRLIHSLMEDVENLLLDLLFARDKDWMDSFHLNRLRDVVNKGNLNYSFLTEHENGLSDGRTMMLHRLKGDATR